VRKLSYWLCFALVAIPSAMGLAIWLLSLVGIALHAVSLVFLLSSFGSLVPRMFVPVIPSLVVIVLGYVMLFLVVRRIWLLLAKREGVPHSFVGTQRVLAYVGTSSFVLALVALLLSMMLGAGSGVPAGMLFIPAMFCVPWAFFLTEALSFRVAKTGEA
jgi:hypothetical protein